MALWWWLWRRKCARAAQCALRGLCTRSLLFPGLGARIGAWAPSIMSASRSAADIYCELQRARADELRPSLSHGSPRLSKMSPRLASADTWAKCGVAKGVTLNGICGLSSGLTGTPRPQSSASSRGASRLGAAALPARPPRTARAEVQAVRATLEASLERPGGIGARETLYHWDVALQALTAQVAAHCSQRGELIFRARAVMMARIGESLTLSLYAYVYQ